MVTSRVATATAASSSSTAPPPQPPPPPPSQLDFADLSPPLRSRSASSLSSGSDSENKSILNSSVTSAIPRSGCGMSCGPITPPGTPTIANMPPTANSFKFYDVYVGKLDRFRRALNEPNVDLEALRKLSWSGIPTEVRALTWQLLTGYLPCNVELRKQTQEAKRKQYFEWILKYYDAVGSAALTKGSWESKLQHQIHIDVPRTHPSVRLFQSPRIQQSLERILYIWSVRHPGSAYVQGINDLVTPFLIVFLNSYVDCDILDADIDTLPQEVVDNVEADSFWCFSKLLDGIQDYYLSAHPGIQRMVHKLSEIIRRIDEPLHDHFHSEGLEFIQFAFRWMNNLLMREFPLLLVVRMWDTYLAEGDDFATLHVYVCASFLKNFSDHLRKLPFDKMVLFLQEPKTNNWTFREMELLLSQAYMMKELYNNCPSHFVNTASSGKR